LLGCGLERCRPLAGIPDGLDPLLGELHGRDEGCHRDVSSPARLTPPGILSRRPSPGVLVRRAGIGMALVIPAAFEVGLRNPAVVRDTMALEVFPIRPMGFGRRCRTPWRLFRSPMAGRASFP